MYVVRGKEITFTQPSSDKEVKHATREEAENVRKQVQATLPFEDFKVIKIEDL